MAETSDTKRYIGYFRALSNADRFYRQLMDRDYKCSFHGYMFMGYDGYIVIVDWTSAVWEPPIVRAAEMEYAEKLEKEFIDGHRLQLWP